VTASVTSVPSSSSPTPGLNLFAAAGHSPSEIDTRIRAAWQQLFHGDPGTGNRFTGQSVYYQFSSDMAYVEDIANQDIRSEGMGYAMMISVQLNHKTEFDALWNYAKSKMQQQSGRTKYFFTWHTDTSGNVHDTGIAPDGDQWIAAALAFAANRWGSGQGIYNYQNEATQIIRAMWHESDSGGVNMFDRNTALPVFSPPGAVSYTDPSYCLPAFYKVFANVVPSDAASWDRAYNAASQLLQKAPNPNTGLVADYTNFDGTPYGGDSPSDEGYNHTFQEDAWRAIANANVDAAWFGTKSWHTQYSNTLERFFQSKGVTTYPSRYHVNGTLVVHGQNNYEPTHAQGLVAMNSTSAISATESGRLDFVNDFWNTQIPSGQARYYDGLLYMLGLLYDSGTFKMW
jgi:oligosaccharide reducing-end xylanase